MLLLKNYLLTMNNIFISKSICTLFNLGFKSKFPGTLGSMASIIFGSIILYSFSHKVLLILFILLLIIAFYATYLYQKKVGKKDKSEIIIDEFVGQLIPMFFININLFEIILSFLLFRFFDILKVYPTNIIDKKYSNFIGVILDDIIAGFQAAAVILVYLFLYDKI